MAIRTGSSLALLLVFFAITSAPSRSHGSVVSSSEDGAKKVIVNIGCKYYEREIWGSDGSWNTQLYVVYMGEKHHEDPDVVTSLHHDTLFSILGRFVTVVFPSREEILAMLGADEVFDEKNTARKRLWVRLYTATSTDSRASPPCLRTHRRRNSQVIKRKLSGTVYLEG